MQCFFFAKNMENYECWPKHVTEKFWKSVYGKATEKLWKSVRKVLITITCIKTVTEKLWKSVKEKLRKSYGNVWRCNVVYIFLKNDLCYTS